jgi:hypothetical protein
MKSNSRLATAFIFLLLTANSAFSQTKGRARAPEKPSKTAQPETTHPRPVTINLKSGAPVNGNFVQADANNIQLDVAGNRLSIKVDDVTSIAFVAGMIPPVQQAAKQIPPSVEQALRALRKIAGAIEVGVNHLQYSALVIDAKSAVDEALASLPDGELKEELKAAMEAYTDAGTVWNKIVGTDHGPGQIVLASRYGKHEPMWSIHEKYSVPAEPGTTGSTIISADLMQDTIWKAARAHLDKATTVSKQ